jgi:cyclohexanecarboxyl-CoA dehydrogenase
MFGPTIFDSAEEKIMFRREVRRFLQKEVVPTNKERAKLNHVPQELWKKIADQQLLRVNVPEKYGGEPADWITVGILVEEIGRADFLLYHPLLMVHLAWLSLQSASDELQMEWMPALLSGDKVLSVGLTEPECGSDAAAIIARAERNGSDYIINGEKVPVTQGMSSDATLVWASTDKAAGARGITCFLMPHDLPGVTRTPVPYLGYYQLEAATMVMQGVRVPESLRVGKEGDGFYMVMRDFDVARIILALACLGACLFKRAPGLW